MAIVSPPTSVPYGHAAPSVDIETLLWELRDLLRGLVQVNSAETAQLAQLVPTPATFEKVSKEYAERAHVALETIDVALEQLQLVPTANTVPLDDGTVFNASPVRAWLYDTLISVESNLGAIQNASSATSDSTAVEPNTFWNAETSFKWDEEPEEEPSSPIDAEHEGCGADLVSVFSDDSDDLITPWDSVSMRDEDSDVDTESDSELEELQQSRWSSREDTATIFYSEQPDYEPNVTPVAGKKFAPFSFAASLPETLSLFAHRAALAGL